MRIPALLLLACIAVAAPKRAGYLGARLAAAEGGVQLVEVLPGTPAAKAGLQSGDVVVRCGDTDVKTPAALGAVMREAGAGTKLAVVVMRAGEKKTFELTLGVHPRVLLEEPDTSAGMKGVVAYRDLSYHCGLGLPHERHRLNLFMPKMAEVVPIVLWIHAGAWSYGDRDNETALAMRFAERGIGFAAMNYRLSSKFWNEPGASKEGFKHPAHAEDCAMAFAWLRAKFPKHPLFVSGHSCGAHLGALLAMDKRYLGEYGLALDEIKGVIAIGGGYDLVKYHAILKTGMGEKADAHLQWIFGDTKEDWIAASPTTYLKGCSMPMLIVAEKGEAMRQYTKDFEEAVKAAGVTSIRFRYTTDRTHGQSKPLMSRKAPDPVRDEMIEFIRARSR